APLNVLVGESAASNEEGSALGTLSLIRQMGLSLVPTLYAGYIAGAFTNIAPVMKAKYGDLGLENVSGDENYGAVLERTHQFTDPGTRAAVLQTVSGVLKVAFDQMYLAAGVLAFLIMGIGFYLVFKKDKVR